MSDKQAREYIQLIFEAYKKRKNEHRLYEDNVYTTKAIIKAYIKYVKKPKFSMIVDTYKREYIHNESRVEKNISKEEQEGLGIIYDYIDSFDFSKDKFNIFTCSMIIHGKLYSCCPFKSFGGKLRTTTVFLEDTNIEIIDPESARAYFNSLIPKSDELFMNNDDIIDYINTCIIETVKLIKIQPFEDGNKRTFRAVLNLLLKKLNIPPIYIEKYEREIYKKSLLEAIKNDNYEPITCFYYYKICDSIMTLDINKSLIMDRNESYQKKILENF